MWWVNLLVAYHRLQISKEAGVSWYVVLTFFTCGRGVPIGHQLLGRKSAAFWIAAAVLLLPIGSAEPVA